MPKPDDSWKSVIPCTMLPMQPHPQKQNRYIQSCTVTSCEHFHKPEGLCMNNQRTTSPLWNRPRCYAKLPTARDAFRPIPGLISCTGVYSVWDIIWTVWSWKKTKTSLYENVSQYDTLQSILLCKERLWTIDLNFLVTSFTSSLWFLLTTYCYVSYLNRESAFLWGMFHHAQVVCWIYQS